MAVPLAPPSLPSSPVFLVPLKLSSIRTLKFPRNFCSPSPSLQSASLNTDDDPAIGDCLVFEEGIFDDPSLDAGDSARDSSPPAKIPRRKKKLAPEILTENLVPDEWRETQAEINITKKERRRIAQDMQFNSRLERKTRGLAPVRSLNLDEYKAFREAKLAQLKPLVLDRPTPATSPENDEDSDEEEIDEEDEYEIGKSSSERVAPRNPRWAVYGKGFDDVNEFFRSRKYQPGENNSEGRRKLFTKEEKVLLNRKIPDLAAVTCVKWQPLHTLAASGEFYLMNTLLKHNLDINSVDAEGLSALHKAIIGKKQAITSYLLRESANPFIRDEDGATLLHYAVQTASIPAIKLLLLYNVDINLQDNDGWSPLHLAVQARRTDIMKLLLIKGADKTLRNNDGVTPLELCLHLGRDTRTLELIKLLKLYPRKSIALNRKLLSSG